MEEDPKVWNGRPSLEHRLDRQNQSLLIQHGLPEEPYLEKVTGKMGTVDPFQDFGQTIENKNTFSLDQVECLGSLG